LQDKASLASRQSGISSRIDSDTGEVVRYSEIAFPPLDIILSVHGGKPHPKLFDLTWLDQYSYNGKHTGPMKLHCMQTNTHLPADYSTIDQLRSRSRRRG